MKKYQFKTNINCGGCVATIAPVLNAWDEIKSWSVGTSDHIKKLTVETENVSEEELIKILNEARYKAAPLVLNNA
jgi:copper chaperone